MNPPFILTGYDALPAQGLSIFCGKNRILCFSYITLISFPGARKNSTPSFTGFSKMRVRARA